MEKCTGHRSTEEMDLLHSKVRLKTLCGRRKMFMLKMMYKLSHIEGNVNRYRPEVVLRTAPKVKIKVDFTDKERVRRSPYYLCNQLWEKLESSVQLSNNVLEFTKILQQVKLSEL